MGLIEHIIILEFLYQSIVTRKNNAQTDVVLVNGALEYAQSVPSNNILLLTCTWDDHLSVKTIGAILMKVIYLKYQHNIMIRIHTVFSKEIRKNNAS